MLKIPDILSAIVDDLRSIPELVELVGGNAQSIAPYDDENSQYKSVSDAIDSMQIPSILVAHTGTELQGGEMPRWSHRIEAYFRFERMSEGWNAIDAVINGVPDPADGSTWINKDPNYKLHPPSEIAIGYAHNALPALSFTIVEIGG